MKKKTQIDTTKLTADLCTARDAAQRKIAGIPDGGTCCMDYPYVRLPGTAEVVAAFTAAGLSTSPGYGIAKGAIGIRNFPGCAYQGTPRTLGAETFAATLRDLGWDANVYYAID